MPFTAAHPAIILPLKHRFSNLFSTTGLVIGSISPDFAYFLSPIYYTRISHTLKGIFLFNLPITFVLALLLHGFVKEQIIRFLPPYLERRAIGVESVNWFSYLSKNWHVFLISALIGSASHLFWDSFTHYHGWFVRHFDILRSNIDFFGFALPICRWLQHISTLVGLTVVSIYIKHLPAYENPTKSDKYSRSYFWVGVFSFGVLYLMLDRPHGFSLPQLDSWIARFLGGCILAVISLTGFFKIRQLLRRTSKS